ncbi:MAG: flagellar biosynthesis protein [Phaeovulum sp.]|uniref:FliH/SctL family protein n=1 Tax=Phaeovulum sp. TaxID=2934796 RepID=UPI0027306CEE|nr:flagellar biosynthesis protein [Phaeovulum sp.]MDP2062234.1 flagellar biosynthesis protein [Phaeovulum sp.]MDP3863068.1 flagellar biosynthesis protein [Phaeovulum sp.]
MATPFRLEAFDTGDPDLEAVQMNLADLEEAKLTAFEKGFSAGWEDAVAAQEAEAGKLRADLGRNLQALSFNYHEARGHLLHALEPLLRDMVAKVLPAVARETLAAIVLEQLLPMAEKLTEAPVTVMVSPESRETVETALGLRAGFPLRFCEEPSLSDGQVYLRLGETETRVDLDGVIAAIASALSAFFQLENEVSQNG